MADYIVISLHVTGHIMYLRHQITSNKRNGKEKLKRMSRYSKGSFLTREVVQCLNWEDCDSLKVACGNMRNSLG